MTTYDLIWYINHSVSLLWTTPLIGYGYLNWQHQIAAAFNNYTYFVKGTSHLQLSYSGNVFLGSIHETVYGLWNNKGYVLGLNWAMYVYGLLIHFETKA